MPIEFNCPACQSRIRTPDGSAGKMARCPQCGAVATVPPSSPTGSTPSGGWPGAPQSSYGQAPQGQVPMAGFAPPPQGGYSPPPPTGGYTPQNYQQGGFVPAQPGFGGGQTPFPQQPVQPGYPQPGSSPYSPQSPQAPNPFGPPSQSTPGGGFANPYQSPTMATSGYSPSSPEAVRAKLRGPAIGMIVGAVLALIYIAITVGIMIFDMELIATVPDDPQERIGFWIGAGGVLVVGSIAYTLELIGGICLLRGVNRSLAMAGAIGGLMPCNVCCIFGFPFSIWALVAMNDPQVKALYH